MRNVKIRFLFFILLSGMASPAFAQSSPSDPNDGVIDWGREWFLFSHNQSIYQRPAAAPVARPSIFSSRPWYRSNNTSIFGNWWNRTNNFAKDCDNTPKNTPGYIPLNNISGNENGEESQKIEAMNLETGRGVPVGPLAHALALAVEAEARECRETAKHVRERTGDAQLCGANRSKGRCYAAVKDAMIEAGVTPSRIPGAAAIEAHTNGYLLKAGFELQHGMTPQNAHEGCAMVYSGGNGHNYGHIEIKSASGLYCSDYCSPEPLKSSHHKLAAIYCLPKNR